MVAVRPQVELTAPQLPSVPRFKTSLTLNPAVIDQILTKRSRPLVSCANANLRLHIAIYHFSFLTKVSRIGAICCGSHLRKHKPVAKKRHLLTELRFQLLISAFRAPVACPNRCPACQNLPCHTDLRSGSARFLRLGLCQGSSLTTVN